jgi:hypothetical protein
MGDVVSISIPHTGTYFTIKLFTDAGFTDGSLFHQARSDSHVYHGHMIKETQIARAEELALEMPLVIPFRHPYRVAHSWNMRGKPLDEMFRCYEAFVERFLPLKPYLMPVDSDRREEALQRISDGVGVRLTTDWSVVNGMKSTHKLKLEDIPPPSKKLVELVSRLEPVMADLY